MEKQIIQQLNDLHGAHLKREVLELKKQDAMNNVITDEIKQQLKDIEAEFAPDFEQVDNYIKDLEAQVKEMGVQYGGSVDSEFMKAVFNKGRSSWDSKKLEGMALVYPAILECQKTGSPYISLKKK